MEQRINNNKYSTRKLTQEVPKIYTRLKTDRITPCKQHETKIQGKYNYGVVI